MTKPIFWDDAIKYLSKKDKKLGKIILQYEGHLKSKKNPFYSLCKSIIGQQISVQSAESVWKKLVKKCIRISPRNINSMTVQEIRNCGVTRQKTEYINSYNTHHTLLFGFVLLGLSGSAKVGYRI